MAFKQFRRLNFFNGLFTSADDWKAEAKYHADKRQLHNTTLHTPGVVAGLQVKARADGTGVTVTRGSAIDAMGRDLHLDQDLELPIPFDSLQPPLVVQVSLRYAEQGAERRQDAANTQQADFAFLDESADVVVEPQAAALKDVVALASIKLGRDARQVRDAQKASEPQENEIDLRAVRRAGAVGARVSLKEIAKGMISGEADIPAPQAESEAPEDQYVGIPLRDEGDGLFFVASVYPITVGQINWRMGSSREGTKVRYKLFIRNVGKNEVRVGFRVYRLE